MPPRKRTAAATSNSAAPPAPVSLPLTGCKVALCGSFPGISQVALKQHIEKLGATALNAVTPDSSHLVATPENYKKPTAKVKTAHGLGIPIVGVEWLLDSVSANMREPETPHLLSSPSAAPFTVTAAAVPFKGAQAAAPPVLAPSPTNNNGTKKRNATSAASDGSIQTQSTSQPAPKKAKIDSSAINSKPKNAKLDIPVDEYCPLSTATVHVDDAGVIWDASLNQSNSAQNNNKFYRIQVLKKANGQYQTWTRWGRVGEKGQSAVLGNGDLDDALKNFNKKFKDKSGLLWVDRGDEPKPGKYAYVERNYFDDSEDSDNESEPSGAGTAQKKDDYAGIPEPPACTLSAPLQELMELIFNRKFFAATMTHLNYDANKLPLGKLSKTTITRGFQALKDLSALFDDPSLAQSVYNSTPPKATERLSNLYYSVIPHAFGRNRPTLIDDNELLKKEIELLESLSDMKDAELLMKVDRARTEPIHPADKYYRGLGMKEMTALDAESQEFKELADYLHASRGATHGINYDIEEIFRIERQGEQDRFDSCNLPGVSTDTRLLWHGSRATNFGGILGQGLRIAPPEAPVSGYMFGKGIYLADMSSKSANYCYSSISAGTGLLLLCEAKLGSPLQELTSASYTAGETAKEKGMFTTLGQGQTGPLSWKDAGCVHSDLTGVKMPDVSFLPGATNAISAGLLYNEYIVYDVSQVRLRYLFRVRM